MTSRKQWTPERLPRLVILDLDGVLWAETLAENNQSLTLDERLIALLRELDQRGTLLSCVSKNNREEADRVLIHVGIAPMLVAKEISFVPKVLPINRILQTVNVKADDAVFVDDNWREREDANSQLPNLLCIDPKEAKTLFTECLRRTSSIVTCAAKLRKEHYIREEERPYLAAASLVELSTVVASSSLSVYLHEATDQDLVRCAELYSRTHRLNFATRALALSELRDLRESEQYVVYSISVVDRYGPYGLVGCVVLRTEHRCLTIEDFVLSCRVQARRVEEAILTHLLEWADQRGLNECRIRFARTEDNAHLVGGLYELSFYPDKANREIWRRSIVRNGSGNSSHTILPTVVWDKTNIGQHGGIPFVCDKLKYLARELGFKAPIASLGSGYDDVLGENWEHWLAPNVESAFVKRIDIQALPKIDIVDDAEALTSVPDDSFHTVLCLDMLEHAERPWKIPPTVLRILKEGGIAVFSVPCILGIHCEADLWRLTPAGLRHLLETALQEPDNRFGFRVCDVSIEGTEAYPVRTLIVARKALAGGSEEVQATH